MPTFKIAYSGWAQVEVDAPTEQLAIEKFWDNGLNDLYDAEIGDVMEVEEPVEA